jgi:hypothetical protein
MATVFDGYKDYKTAAQRHLMTYQYLVECLYTSARGLRKKESITYYAET